MSEETLHLETLAKRLDVVEKYNLRFKRLGIGIALLGILGGFLGGVISAKIFQIQKTTMPSKVIEAGPGRSGGGCPYLDGLRRPRMRDRGGPLETVQVRRSPPGLGVTIHRFGGSCAPAAV
jgi:hypothetical protein